MNELQSILLNLLKQLLSLFEELQIPYFLTEGSCLGAVRHGGFIPWDDDIDVVIYAKDYGKLINSAPKILDKRYKIIGAFEQKKYINETDMISRIIDMNYDIEMNIFKEKKIFHPWIDISLICGLPKSRILARLFMIKMYTRKAFIKLSNNNAIGFYASKNRSNIERILLSVIQTIDISKFFDEIKQSDLLRKLVLNNDDVNSEYVIAFPSEYGFRECMKKSIYGNGVKTSFEGVDVVIPELFDEYLKIIYGDYMTLPSIEERKGKHKFILRNNH